MVSYQTLTAIAFEVAREKGAQFDGQRPENATSIVQIVADEWNSDKNRYKQMTEAQARRELNGILNVQ